MSSHRSSRRTHAESHAPRRTVVGCLALLAGVLLGALAAGPALALPEGRVYEMVSPPYKGGYGVTSLEGVAPDGEAVAFYSNGAFAGAPAGGTYLDYVSHRSESGWVTMATMAPAGLLPNIEGSDISPSLGTKLIVGSPGPNASNAFHLATQEDVALHDTSTPDTVGNWELAGAPFEAPSKGVFSLAPYDGASADFCHVFLDKTEVPLLPVAQESAYPEDVVYEVDRGCDGEQPAQRVVEMDNSGTELDPKCISVLPNKGLGSEGFGQINRFNAIAAGGREVFFTSCATGGSFFPWQLFVRLGGVKTLEVSKPLGEACHVGEAPGQVPEVPCAGGGSRAPANFAGASEDGSKVFFTTAAKLAPGDEDSATDLYMASIGCPSGEGEGCPVARREVTSVVQVSHDVHPGEAAEVQGVVRVAPDGERVYYIARGVLGEGANAEGQVPAAGADNLYVYDSVTGTTNFVAELCSGPEASGGADDRNCPLEGGEDFEAGSFDVNLWKNGKGNAEVQTAGQGGAFLVFSSYGRLVGSDTDNAKDVYRYDAETGVLERVSSGEAGYDSNGNQDDVPVGGRPGVGADATIARSSDGQVFVREQYDLGTRAVSDDGSRIVFTSSVALSPGATNGLANVYEWHKEPGWSEGRVSLISTGSSEEPVAFVVISGTGNDIFFLTAQGLVPQDTDGAPDIYDARLGGGFPVVAAQPQACSGDACQGPLTNPAPLLVPGSVSQAPGENLPVPAPVVGGKAKSKAKPRVKKHARKRKGRHASRAHRATAASFGRTGR